jgi:hypothetical protein
LWGEKRAVHRVMQDRPNDRGGKQWKGNPRTHRNDIVVGKSCNSIYDAGACRARRERRSQRAGMRNIMYFQRKLSKGNNGIENTEGNQELVEYSLNHQLVLPCILTPQEDPGQSVPCRSQGRPLLWSGTESPALMQMGRTRTRTGTGGGGERDKRNKGKN